MSESREEENPQIVCQKISEPRKLPHRKENQENMFEGIGKCVRRGGGVNLTRGGFSVRKYGIFTILICNCKLPYTCHFVIFFKTKS